MGLFILQRIDPYAFGSHGPFKGIPIIEQSSQQMMNGRLKSSNLARNISPCDVESPVGDIKLNTTKKCMSKNYGTCYTMHSISCYVCLISVNFFFSRKQSLFNVCTYSYNVCMYVYVYVFMYACMFECISLFIFPFVCMYVYMYGCLY